VTSAPNPATDLEDIRRRIDAVDRELLDVLAKRMALVAELAVLKRRKGLRIRDPARERQVLEDRGGWARERALPPEAVESLFRLIMRASRDRQAALHAESPPRMAPKTIAIIGAQGAMGSRMCELFESLGHRVLAVDQDTALTAEVAARQADVTLIAVPIGHTEAVIRRIGPHVRAAGLLMDITSVKQRPVAAMLAATSASVVGTHPMFGPKVHTLQGQRVVLCPGRGDGWLDWVESNLRAGGLTTTRASAAEHDRAMASVQVLTHFQTQVLGLTLARLGEPLANSLRFTSPAYLIELYVAARHFGQDPMLYGPIEMENPLMPEVTKTFEQAAQSIRAMLVAQDQVAFSRMFEEVQAFFGAFTAEATEQSGFLIDRLVERS
jgi:chorismate mutase/prephenate dehydrogenase